MAEKFKFDLVSPEKMIMSEDVTQVTVPGAEGQFGVFAGHAPVMSSLRPGMIDIVSDGGTRQVFIRGGFVEVTQTAMTVLAEEAIPAEDLKPETIAQSIKDADEDLADAKDEASRQKAQETLDQLKEVQTALGV